MPGEGHPRKRKERKRKERDHEEVELEVEFDEAEDAIEQAQKLEKQKGNGRVRTLNLIRGYVLLAVGCGLLIFGVIGGAKPGALTLGGALVGFNPLFRATVSS